MPEAKGSAHTPLGPIFQPMGALGVTSDDAMTSATLSPVLKNTISLAELYVFCFMFWAQIV
jgi:hypothetical protein